MQYVNCMTFFLEPVEDNWNICTSLKQAAFGCCAIYTVLKARKLINLAKEDSSKRQTTVATLVAIGNRVTVWQTVYVTKLASWQLDTIL